MAKLRDFDRHDEVGIQDQIRSTAPLSKTLYKFIAGPRVAAIIYATLTILLVLAPAIWPIILIIWAALYLILLGHRYSLPFNAPFCSNTTDYNDVKIGRTGFNQATGIFLIGNVLGSLEELYLNFNNLLRHILVFGTTGAGKTEAMVSFGANFIATGSGLIYNDAKASPSLAWQIYTLARYFGRDDDFLIINYLTGNTSSSADPAQRLTNDSAPFAFGSAEASSQLIISLLPVDGGANKVFSDAAIALIQSVMPALTELREKGLLRIDPKLIRSYMEYSNCCELMTNPFVSLQAREAVVSFIRSRAGYDKTRPYNMQPEEVKKQFGFAQAYFIRALSALSDVYGHIYMTGAGEVDYRDIILNDRIVCTLLPSLQYSGDELSNLGKIILSSIRNAMAIGLGYEIEGRREDVLESLPTSSNKPIGIINDEYAYMAVEGFAITAAQGRGLNCTMIFGGQDYAGFKRASEMEAEQIVANARLKYVMALEDVHSTLDLVKKLAGEAYVSLTEGYEDKDSFTTNYKDSRRTRYQKVDRVTSHQLRALGQGEGYAFYEDKMELVKNFWHGFTEKDLVSEYKVGRRLVVNIRSSRGPLSRELDQTMVESRVNIDIWLDHLDEPVDASILTCPDPLLVPIESIQQTLLETLPSPDMGQAFINSLGQKHPSIIHQGDDEDDDTENTKPSLLSSLSGTYDQQKNDVNEELEAAVQEVEELIKSMSITPQSPLATPLIDHPVISTDDPISDTAEPAQSELFKPAEEEVIARGVGRITQAGGGTPKQAQEAGLSTVTAIRAMSRYPKPVAPQKTDSNQDRLTELIQNFIHNHDDPE